MIPEDEARIEATSADFKALAHPLRLRMIRLCLHEARTNKQLADLLDLDPATALYHVRTLVGAGFLEAEAVRSGESGALEKPYRATRKSWQLAIPDAGDQLTAVLAGVDALRAELIEAGPEALLTNARLGLQLSPDDTAELGERLRQLAAEYAARPSVPGGERVGMFLTLHRLE